MGQARIPRASDIFHLLRLATDEGWFITAEKNRDDEYSQLKIAEDNGETS
jgi:hypothetical protein